MPFLPLVFLTLVPDARIAVYVYWFILRFLMYRCIESFHEYSSCRLKETLPNGQPTRFAAFVRGITDFVTRKNNENDRANGEVHSEGGSEHHQITERKILLCEDAVKDSKLKD